MIWHCTGHAFRCFLQEEEQAESMFMALRGGTAVIAVPGAGRVSLCRIIGRVLPVLVPAVRVPAGERRPGSAGRPPV